MVTEVIAAESLPAAMPSRRDPSVKWCVAETSPKARASCGNVKPLNKEVQTRVHLSVDRVRALRRGD